MSPFDETPGKNIDKGRVLEALSEINLKKLKNPELFQAVTASGSTYFVWKKRDEVNIWKEKDEHIPTPTTVPYIGALAKSGGNNVRSSDIIKVREHLEIELTSGYKITTSPIKKIERLKSLGGPKEVILSQLPTPCRLFVTTISGSEYIIEKTTEGIKVSNEKDENIKNPTSASNIKSIEEIHDKIVASPNTIKSGEQLRMYFQDARVKDMTTSVVIKIEILPNKK